MITKKAGELCFDANGEVKNPFPNQVMSEIAEGARSSIKNLFSPENTGKLQKYAALNPAYSPNEKLANALKKFTTAKTASVRNYWMKQAAEMMGNTNDMELETAIFTLSSHFIKDKAAKLFDLNYFVGFRILDKNDDNTKVVGIYGFKIGKAWVYIPIFFDKGRINGFELCYLQNRDQFVPLKEGWIDWIIKNSGDEMFGKKDTKDFRELGIRYPDMKQLTQPPALGKVASFEPWVQQGVLALAKQAASVDKLTIPIDLEKIASTDSRIFMRLVSACDKYPLIKVAVDSFHDSGMFKRAYDRLIARYAKIANAKKEFRIQPITRKNAAVTVITKKDTSAFPYLTEKQAEELVETGNLVIDQREDDEVAVVEDEMQFESPTKTGVYDVFFADGNIRECLVIVNPLGIKRKPNREISLVVDWKRKRHIYAKTMAILCVRGSAKEDWFNRLPAEQFKTQTSMRSSEAKECNDRVIITPDGFGTCPFRAVNNDGVWQHMEYQYLKGRNRDTTYDVNEGLQYSISRLNDLMMDRYNPTDQLKEIGGTFPRWIICSTTFAGNKAVLRDDKLILPGKFKYIDLERDDSLFDDGTGMALATENDIVQLMFSNRKKLKITKTASKYVIDRKDFTKESAFKTLVVDYAFRNKTASEILMVADLAYGQTLTIPYVEPMQKVADLPIDPVYGGGGFLSDMPDNTMSPVFQDNQLSTDSYSGLPIDGGMGSTQQLGYEDQPIPPDFLNEVPPPDPMALQQAAEAAQTGRKDVFDVSTLVALLSSNRREDMLRDYTSDLKGSLDVVGRLLFGLFWDRDRYIDLFGDEDIGKFEDALKDTLDILGDLVLFLLQKDDTPELKSILSSI
jgi:hypothetical protein